jgi:DNA-binding YbaB/EbfC family protein
VSDPQQQMQMLQQIQKMQQDMQAAQEELLDARVEATAGGGVVKATVTGNGELVAISIDPGVVDPTDVETLEDLILAAVTEANRQARELAQQKLGGVTSGIDLGGLGGLGGGLGGLFG